MMRVGVLASGSGSNFQALVEGLAGGPASVAVLVCDVPGAKVLERAKAAGVPGVTLVPRTFGNRDAHEAAVVQALVEHGVELVCLAGYMRLIGERFLDAFPGKVLNVHPALLPSFKGLHGARQALEAGVKVTGCTVHFVDAGMDTGPIVAQAAVPVRPGDDEATLSARIQEEEHRLYPRVVRAIAAGQVRLDGRTVILTEPIE